MGWWSETVFGGDEPLDALDEIKESAGVALPGHLGQGYGDPSEWGDEARAAWAARASEVDAVTVRRVDEARAQFEDAATLCAAVLARAAGVELTGAVREHARNVAAAAVRSVEQWGQEVRRRRMDESHCVRVLEGWRELAAAVDGAAPVTPHALLSLPQGGSQMFAAWSAVTAAVDPVEFPDSLRDKAAAAAVIAAAPRHAAAIAALQGRRDEFVPAVTDEMVVPVQVAAALVMGTGKPMSERLRGLALSACTPERDPWGGRDEKRNAVLESVAAAVRAYRGGEPVVFSNEGLFEAFAKHQGGGLVNKGPGTR